MNDAYQFDMGSWKRISLKFHLGMLSPSVIIEKKNFTNAILTFVLWLWEAAKGIWRSVTS